MTAKNDGLELNLADLKRRNSTPCIRIGADVRVNYYLHSLEKKEKIKLLLGQLMILSLILMLDRLPNTQSVLGEALQDQIHLCLAVLFNNIIVGTTNLVGPSSYF